MSELYECLIEEGREDPAERIQKKYILGIVWSISCGETLYRCEKFAVAFSEESTLLCYVEERIKDCESILESARELYPSKQGYVLTVYADYHNIDCLVLDASENNISRMMYYPAKTLDDSEKYVRFCTEDLEVPDTLCRRYVVAETVEDSGYRTFRKCRATPFC